MTVRPELVEGLSAACETGTGQGFDGVGANAFWGMAA